VCERHAHAAQHQMIAVGRAHAHRSPCRSGYRPAWAPRRASSRDESLPASSASCSQHRLQTSSTVNPAHSASAASSVKSSAAVTRGAAVGVQNDVEPKRLRRLRDPQARAIRRRGRHRTRIASTTLIVSVTGTAGTAAPVRQRRHRSRARSPCPRSRTARAASWIRTMSGCVGLRAPRGPRMHRGLTRRAAIHRRLVGAGDATASVEDRGVVRD
jgi:hypothetical protein